MSNSKLVKNSLIYVLLGFFPLALNFILAPIYSSYISPTEYGIVALATILQSVLIVLISLGLDGAFSRLYFDFFQKNELVHGLMSTLLVCIIVVSITISILLELTGDTVFNMILNNSDFTYSKYGRLVWLTTFSTVIQTIFLSYYRNQENVKIYSIIALVYFIISASGILIGVVYFEAQAIGNIGGRAYGMALVSVPLILFYFFKRRLVFKISYLKSALTYSLPLIPYLLLLALYNNIDKIMVEQFFELETLGLYNFAFLLASVISVLIYAIFNALSPRIYKILSTNSNSLEPLKISKVFHLVITGLIVLAIAVIIPLIDFIIAESYHEIKSFIAILILVYFFQLYYVLFTIPIFYHKKTQALPWISLGVLITGVLSNYFLIPIFGILGVCLALVCTKLFQFLFAIIYVKKINLPCEYLKIKKNNILTLAIIGLFGTFYLLNIEFNFASNEVINILPLIVYLVSIYLLFKMEIKSLFNSLLNINEA